MKKKFSLFALIVVFSLVFLAGCSAPSDDSDSGEETYVVWTDFSTYSDYYSNVGVTLDDGYYSRVILTNDQFDSAFATLENILGQDAIDEYKHEWTFARIKSWFIGRGFGDSEAEKESNWLITTSHGMIISRSKNTVYYIIK